MSQRTEAIAESSKQAKELGLRYFFTGKPCKYGHITARDTKHCNRCVKCIREANNKAQRKYAEKPLVKERQAQHMANWRLRNLEECRLKGSVQYYQKQLDKALNALLTHQASK